MVLSHSFALSGNKEPLIGTVTLGTAGVWVFFILSGYLIAISWDQYPRFNVFFAKRALRVFPGLIVNVLLTVLVIGAVYSAMPFWEFLSKNATLEYLNNIFLYTREHALPGVFTDNIYPKEVNGSLWTLAYEFTMYITVALIGVFNIYKKVSAVKIWASLFILEAIILLSNVNLRGVTIFFLHPDRLIFLALLFFSGIVMYKYAHKIKLSYKWGSASFVAFLLAATLLPQFTPLYGATLLAYAVFSIGRSSLMSGVSKIGDLSYGIYIYSFPIQQMVAASTHTHSPLKLFLASFVLSMVAAALSWHFIEARALGLKHKINTKKYPLLQADEAW